MEVFAEAATMQAQGRDIVHQEIGEPDFATPQHIVEAGIRALQAGHAHCCPAPGVPERREATAAHVVATRNIQAQPEQLVVTSGTLEKMAAALQPLWARP